MRVNQRKAGVIISYAGQLVHVLTALLYTPVMLRLLGQSEYGLYQLVYSVVSYLSLLSLGFSASYMRFYAREKAADNQEGISKLNGMFMLIFSVIAFICVMCGIAMVVNIRGIFGTGLTDLEYGKAKILMVLMVINLTLSFPNSVFNCIITSQERFLFQKTLIFCQYLFNPFLTLPLLLAGYGSIAMVSVTTFLTVTVLVLNAYYCLVKLHARFSFHELHFSLLKEMWIFTFFIFLNQIVDQVNWSVDKFLLGRMIGTTSVAIYGVGGQINTLYLQLSSAVSNVFIPEVNRIVAEKRGNDELTGVFVKVGRVQFIIMALVLTGFWIFGKPFVEIWAGPGYTESYYVSLLLITPVTIPLIQNLGIEIQRAKNKHKARSVVYFCIAIANIGLSIPLIKSFGATGAAIGTAVSLFAGNAVFMNWYYKTRIGLDIKLFWKNIASFIPSILIPVVFGVGMYKLLPMNNTLILFLSIAVYTLIYIISIFLFGANSQEKQYFTSIYEKIFIRKKKQ